MGVVWTFLFSSILFSPLSPSLWETARYRLKYCLKGPLNPKQPTNQITACRSSKLYQYIFSYKNSVRLGHTFRGGGGGTSYNTLSSYLPPATQGQLIPKQVTMTIFCERTYLNKSLATRISGRSNIIYATGVWQAKCTISLQTYVCRLIVHLVCHTGERKYIY